jgi:hypothetical protein
MDKAAGALSGKQGSSVARLMANKGSAQEALEASEAAAKAKAAADKEKKEKGRAGTKEKASKRKSQFTKKKTALRKSMYEGEAAVEGYLCKLSSGLRGAWAMRWFQLSGHYLKYFTNPQSLDTVRGVVDMHGLASVVHDAENADNKFQFKVTMETGESIYLRAPNKVAVAAPPMARHAHGACSARGAWCGVRVSCGGAGAQVHVCVCKCVSAVARSFAREEWHGR